MAYNQVVHAQRNGKIAIHPSGKNHRISNPSNGIHCTLD